MKFAELTASRVHLNFVLSSAAMVSVMLIGTVGYNHRQENVFKLFLNIYFGYVSPNY